MGFKNGRIPAVSKAHLTGILWSPASQGLEYGSICESVPVMNQVSRTFDKICLRWIRYAKSENIVLARIRVDTNGHNF